MRNKWYPERFQGIRQRQNYFEGWYFKVLNASCDSAYAFIPGISMDAQGKRHSFIQVLNGKTGKAEYHRFPFEAFKFNKNKFDVSIDSNHFSAEHISIDLPGISGELSFENNVKWPKRLFSPGVMGPFTYAPFMECYHGVVSMNHDVYGYLQVGEQRIDYNGGRGYTEKDWGSSFPGGYIWLHSNHFRVNEISLMFSLAQIPWLGMKFKGYLCGLLYKGELLRFTTYNGCCLKEFYLDSKEFRIQLRNRKYLLIISGESSAEASRLASPVQGEMSNHIEETMNSSIRLQLKDRRSGQTVLDDWADQTALEIAGNTNLIIKKKT